jgi:hypothetical protein
MVSNVPSSVTVTTTPPDNSQSTTGKTLVHTPFGDVMVDPNSKPDFYALFHPMVETATPQRSASQSADTAQGSPQQTSTQSSPSQSTTPAQASSTDATPTMESKFGSQPWMSNPGGTGPNGEKWSYNPIYFATQATAETVASLVGGTVIQKDDIITGGGGPFQQTAQNELIHFADGRTVNAGLIANIFNHGYSQSYVDAQLKAITDGDQV